MKNHSLLYAALALTPLALLPPGVALASCGTSTIVGSYGFAADGFGIQVGKKLDSAVPVAIAGTYNFFADGSVKRIFTISTSGEIGDATDSGSYTVNEDCTGRASINTPFGVETIKLTIIQGGKAVYFINATTGIVLAGRMERQ